jgi:hypothetical protein
MIPTKPNGNRPLNKTYCRTLAALILFLGMSFLAWNLQN